MKLIEWEISSYMDNRIGGFKRRRYLSGVARDYCIRIEKKIDNEIYFPVVTSRITNLKVEGLENLLFESVKTCVKHIENLIKKDFKIN